MVCHSRAAEYVLGLSDLQMNREHDYGSAHANQLRTLAHIGVFREEAAEGKSPPLALSSLPLPPEKYGRLADPDDPRQDLAARARSYLHANCAQCHVEAGGGNSQMDLRFTTKLEKAGILDVKPLHHTFSLPDARLIAPGSPERSILLHRMSHRGAGYMPPLATSLVDRQAVQLLGDWIRQLPAGGKPEK
jgi:mono/diheme cytochrome c family protein